MNPMTYDRLNVALLAVALLGLVSGIALLLAGQTDLSTLAWTAGVLPVLAALVRRDTPKSLEG